MLAIAGKYSCGNGEYDKKLWEAEIY